MLSRADALWPFSEASGILDNGCGPGPVMSRLIEDYGSVIPKSCTLTCADFSEPMIEVVVGNRERASADSVWKRVEAKVQNAMDLSEVEDGSQSHITAGWVYFMTPDPQKCLSESRRVLKTHGVLSLSSWEDSQWMKLMRTIGQVRPDLKLPELPKEWSSDAGVKTEMEKAGFWDVEAHRVHVQMHVESHERLVEMILTKMPHMIALTKDMSEEEVVKTREIMGKELKEMCPRTPGKLAGVSIVGVGRR